MRPAATRKLIAASRGDEFSPNSTSIGDERGKEPRMTDRLIARSRSTIVLVAGAVAAWAVTVDRMRGMDAGPGTDLGGLGWFAGIWVTMMAAMMLPSVAPMVLAFARLTKERARRGQAVLVPTWVFVAGYFAAWTAYGLVAYGLFRAVDAVDGGALAWDRAGPYLAGGAIVAEGIYQLKPVKE